MFNNHISNSKNRIKTTWNIIKSVTGRDSQSNHNVVDSLRVKPDSFNNYFLLVAEKL
jgi:hypothetical protein